MNWKRYNLILVLSLVIFPYKVEAVDYSCQVNAKYDFEKVYTKDEIKKWQFGAKIEDSGNEAFISRCSYSSIEGQVTCDRYKVDRVEFDKNVSIKKYYVFRSHYNIQLFHDLSFLEDNGRGSVSYGKCVVVSP